MNFNSTFKTIFAFQFIYCFMWHFKLTRYIFMRHSCVGKPNSTCLVHSFYQHRVHPCYDQIDAKTPSRRCISTNRKLIKSYKTPNNDCIVSAYGLMCDQKMSLGDAVNHFLRVDGKWLVQVMWNKLFHLSWRQVVSSGEAVNHFLRVAGRWLVQAMWSTISFLMTIVPSPCYTLPVPVARWWATVMFALPCIKHKKTDKIKYNTEA